MSLFGMKNNKCLGEVYSKDETIPKTDFDSLNGRVKAIEDKENFSASVTLEQSDSKIGSHKMLSSTVSDFSISLFFEGDRFVANYNIHMKSTLAANDSYNMFWTEENLAKLQDTLGGEGITFTLDAGCKAENCLCDITSTMGLTGYKEKAPQVLVDVDLHSEGLTIQMPNYSEGFTSSMALIGKLSGTWKAA